MMPLDQKIAVICFIVCFLAFVFNLVRTRRLREIYSAFWLLAGFLMLILVIRYDWLLYLTRLLGIGLPTSTVLFLGFVFVFAVLVQVSSALSRKHNDVQQIIQELALLNHEMQELKKEINQVRSRDDDRNRRDNR